MANKFQIHIIILSNIKMTARKVLLIFQKEDENGIANFSFVVTISSTLSNEVDY